MSTNEMARKIAELEAENAKLKAMAETSRTSIKLSDSGYVEVYGIPGKGRFSMSCTPEGWTRLFSLQTQITEFCKANATKLAELQAAYRAKNSKAVG